MKKIIFIALLSFTAMVTYGQDFQVPKDYKLKEKEDYKPYEPQILQAIDWALNTPLDKEVEKRQEAYGFIMAWISGAPNVTVNVYYDIVNISSNNTDLLLPFIMGWIKYSLENNYSADDLKGTKAGIEALVKFYEDNKKLLKKDKAVEKYKKLIEDNKLEEELKKKLK